MNVDKLLELANTVKKGYHDFGRYKILFNMGTIFTPDTDDRWNYSQWAKEGAPSNLNCAGCLIAFTLLLNGREDFLTLYHDEDVKIDNMAIEARHLLGLNEEQTSALFFGTLSSSVTGEDAKRVIKSLLVTGDVDWFLIHR
ncbi:MAG: hypothetical protein D1H97_20360 [Paracoccus sp. BP8]|nr:MAG: hypothetical protein D1H97_20360 [Paracoccus sp. BP8]